MDWGKSIVCFCCPSATTCLAAFSWYPPDNALIIWVFELWLDRGFCFAFDVTIFGVGGFFASLLGGVSRCLWRLSVDFFQAFNWSWSE